MKVHPLLGLTQVPTYSPQDDRLPIGVAAAMSNIGMYQSALNAKEICVRSTQTKLDSYGYSVSLADSKQDGRPTPCRLIHAEALTWR